MNTSNEVVKRTAFVSKRLQNTRTRLKTQRRDLNHPTGRIRLVKPPLHSFSIQPDRNTLSRYPFLLYHHPCEQRAKILLTHSPCEHTYTHAIYRPAASHEEKRKTDPRKRKKISITHIIDTQNITFVFFFLFFVCVNSFPFYEFSWSSEDGTT